MKTLWIAAWSLCGLLSLAQANDQTGYLPGEFVVTFQPGVQVAPKKENGIVHTGVPAVDALNDRYGVYDAASGATSGQYLFKVPADVNIPQAAAEYRKLLTSAEPILPMARADKGAIPAKSLAAVYAGGSNPAALFDGRLQSAGGLQSLVYTTYGPQQQGGILKVACNPALEDCGGSQPAAKPDCNPALEDCAPTPPARKPDCNSALEDCGGRSVPPPAADKPHCNPGINCTGDHPEDTPPTAPSQPPANWSQQPAGTPDRFPQPDSNEPYLHQGPEHGWTVVTGSWGFPIVYTDGFGDFDTGRESIVRGGEATGRGQRSNYKVSIDSTRYAAKYHRYYRYVGSNCRDYSGATYCESWGVKYAWYFIGNVSDTRTAAVDVQFNDDKPLLPWETEQFSFSFDGYKVLPQVGGSDSWAYDYRVEGPMQNYSNGHAMFVINGGAKLRTAPDSAGVSVGLTNEGGQVKLVVHDKWASFYAGEPLDIAVRVLRKTSCKNGSGWWHDHTCTDPVATVFDSKMDQRPNPGLRIVIPDGANGIYAQSFIVDQGAGTYSIDTSWGAPGFRRAESKVSNSSWQRVGLENKAVKK